VSPAHIGQRAWLAVALLLILPSLMLWPSSAAQTEAGPPGLALQVLGWRADQSWAEPWRWWSAAWTHLGLSHLIPNLLGAALVLALGWRAALPRTAAWAWALAWPLTHLALAGQAGLAYYGGLSGVLHAGVAVVGVGLWRLGEPGRERRIGLALLAGLLLKLLIEGLAADDTGLLLKGELTVVTHAHVAGVAAGLLSGGLLMQPGRG
jgi:hypothetical protein